MAKLGKKARKFAKKNLQSVYKRQRKLKSFFKRKSAKRGGHHELEGGEEKHVEQTTKRTQREDVEDVSIDEVFGEDDSQVLSDDSGSDGYLSEDSGIGDAVESDNHEEGDIGNEALPTQTKDILLELQKKKMKLDKLKKKDPEFSKFLESYNKAAGQLRDQEDYSDDDDTSDHHMQSMDNGDSDPTKRKLINCSVFQSWCQLVQEQHSLPALTSLLNGYRAACHYGNEQSGILDTDVRYEIQDSETFGKILMFLLHKADSIFREMLGVSLSTCKKETILELSNTSRWKNLKLLIKSYLRSTLFLLSQATDSDILAFSLTRIRASLIFFSAFPYLLRRLIKSAVHLWVTGEGALSLQSFLIIKDVAVIFTSDCFDTCLVQTYKAFIGHCKFMGPVSSKHLLFLRNSLVELCSEDIQKSYSKAAISIQQLANIVQLGLQTKEKGAVQKTHSWQYMNCIDLWVTFVSENIRDYDLQPLLYALIQIINGVARLFPGPRYLPLRVKCIQWLNHLSSSSGTFIPLTSLVLDILEYKTGKDTAKPGNGLEVSSSVKVQLPKSWLKSRNFQEHCVFCVVELLAVHFAQWSYHISFPELATIPVMRLRKFYETTATENLKRVVKRFIEQVEKNMEFVQRKRDEASFSPKDLQSVETFLQLEKCSGNAPFTQLYKSIIEKAASRNLSLNEKKSPRKLGNRKGNKKGVNSETR